VGQQIDIVPPGSPESTVRPSRPSIDPTQPKVPVYVPPEPPTLSSGDVSQPPVYVPPPSPSLNPQSAELDGGAPVYVPPKPNETEKTENRK
jgi:hypothetical protein